MPKNAKGTQILAALLMTVSSEVVLLLLLGWGGVKGWIDAGNLLWPTTAAVGIASAIGATYMGAKRWSAVPAALLTGVGAQLILLLAGYFVFGNVGFSKNRWALLIAGFLAALLSVLLLSKPKSGAKMRKARRRGK